MKRILAVALLLSAAELSAMSYEEAQGKIATAQSRVEAMKKRIEEHRASIDNGHGMTKSIDGKHEYRNDMNRRKSQVRQAIAEHNKTVKNELMQAEAHLQAAISEVGRHHQIVSDGERYSVVRAERRNLQPIRSAMPARAARTSTN